MGNRSKGKSGSTGNKNNRTKLRSSGMKQRGKGSSSGYKPNSRSNKKSKGCFITTATCKTLNKGDNCKELMTIRNFRDNWLKNQPNGTNIIENYYSIAPKIVEKINQQENNIEIYKNIWDKYLNPFFNTIIQNNNKLAYKIYQKMVNDLEIKHLK